MKKLKYFLKEYEFMRVITGILRGKKLKTLEGNDVRPTTDRVKEAIFSIIQFQVQGCTFLDLFCGSGQMGIEALSRGADFVSFVDNSDKSLEVTKTNLLDTKMMSQARLTNSDAKTYLRTTKTTFDIAFLDPPYNKGILEEILPLLSEKMKEDSIVICEHEERLILPEKIGNLTLKKVYKHGTVWLTAYVCGEEL